MAERDETGFRWPDDGGAWLAVDWGTTNRRAWRIGADGQVQDRTADELGVASVAPGGFPRAVAMLRAQLGDHPMLLAGMIGSNRGWQEAPYVPVPAAPDDVARALQWVEPGRAGIVPGLCQRDGAADVMRGEEVQLFGAVSQGAVRRDALICHPGTHAKWAEMENGRIVRFMTVMTGEMFGLLKAHSILGPQLSGEPADGPAFRAGVAEGLGGRPVTGTLFGIRARHLLEQEPADGASFASGLLIGADVRAGLDFGSAGAPVDLIGRPDLCALYAVALEIAGRQSRQTDGEAAFLAGIAALAACLTPLPRMRPA